MRLAVTLPWSSRHHESHIPAAGRPEDLLMSVVPVPPVAIRPSVEMDGASNEDDVTMKLMVWKMSAASLPRNLLVLAPSSGLMCCLLHAYCREPAQKMAWRLPTAMYWCFLRLHLGVLSYILLCYCSKSSR